MHWSVQFINQDFKVFLSITSSSWGFIVLRCSLICLLPNKASLERFHQMGLLLGQFLGKFFLYLSTCTTLVLPCSDCTEGSDKSARVVSENFLVCYFHLFQFPTIISSTFFLRLMISGYSWSVAPCLVF